MQRVSSRLIFVVCAMIAVIGSHGTSEGANPVITEPFTADPAAMVYDGAVYLHTGHDEAPERKDGYVMKEWLCFSSMDMVHWTPHGSPLGVGDFKWARGDAWAGQVIARDGNFYWYTPVRAQGFAIGVAVSRSPLGPFHDAIGAPLVTRDMLKDAKAGWACIDPTVFIDDDGQAYLCWGNSGCYFAKLKRNMIELDGPIETLAPQLPGYTEASWLHKHDGLYYLSYAYGFPEKLAYATADKIAGPWTFRGILNELAGNCNTNHEAIIEYKSRSYFIYHNGGTPIGGSFRRSVCVDDIYYNPDNTLKWVI